MMFQVCAHGALIDLEKVKRSCLLDLGLIGYRRAGNAEDRGQRTEDRGQRTEVRGQRSEVRGHVSTPNAQRPMPNAKVRADGIRKSEQETTPKAFASRRR